MIKQKLQVGTKRVNSKNGQHDEMYTTPLKSEKNLELRGRGRGQYTI